MASTTPIHIAARKALKREGKTRFNPIIVFNAKQWIRLVPIHNLFLAQNKIMTNLHNQRLYTITNGLDLNDREAYLRFLEYAQIKANEFPKQMRSEHNVRCEHCNEIITYTLADIIRCFPQISQGITIEEKMGSRSYWVYIRHKCGNLIREIPAQHDHNFEYRAQRSARIFERYV